MRNYAQWGLVALFFVSTVYFLCMSFSWMRKGKPTRWKNGYTILRVLSIVCIALLLVAIVFLICKNYSMMHLFVLLAYLATSIGTHAFVPKRKDIEY